MLRPWSASQPHSHVPGTEEIWTKVSPGKAISRLASQLGCSRIVIGTRRESALIRLVSNSVTAGLLEHATVPVEVISRGEAPGWMRFGMPAGLGALLALLVAD